MRLGFDAEWRAVSKVRRFFFSTARHLFGLKSWEVGHRERKVLKTFHAQAMRELEVRADLARSEAVAASSKVVEDVQGTSETGLPKVKLSLIVDQTMDG